MTEIKNIFLGILKEIHLLLKKAMLYQKRGNPKQQDKEQDGYQTV